MNDQIKRIDSDNDPERCQAVNDAGQCRNKRVPGTNFCQVHGGASTALRREKVEGLRNYRLTQAAIKEQIAEKATSTGIKSLRDEVAIARMVLQEIVNKCKDASDLMLYHGQIDKSVLTIEKLVTSCHKLETNLNMTLDKQAILVIVGQVVEIITSTINSRDDIAVHPNDKISLINDISEQLFEVVKSVGE